jgi:hypothetical protein
LHEITLCGAVSPSVIRAPTEHFCRIGRSAHDLPENHSRIALLQRGNDFCIPVKQQHLSRVPAAELEI